MFFFVCLAARGAFLTNENLKKINITFVIRCNKCKCSSEEVDRLLVCCKVVSLWRMVLNCSATQWVMPVMAGSGNSMLYSLLLFIATLSLQEVYRGKLASSELYTILGGFTSSLIFILLLTFIGNYQETCGVRTGWGAVILAEVVALIAASTVHRVSITTCFLFSAALLYEVNKLSGVMVSRSEPRGKRY